MQTKLVGRRHRTRHHFRVLLFFWGPAGDSDAREADVLDYRLDLHRARYIPGSFLRSNQP